MDEAKELAALRFLVRRVQEWRDSGEVDLALPKRCENDVLDALRALELIGVRNP